MRSLADRRVEPASSRASTDASNGCCWAARPLLPRLRLPRGGRSLSPLVQIIAISSQQQIAAGLQPRAAHSSSGASNGWLGSPPPPSTAPPAAWSESGGLEPNHQRRSINIGTFAREERHLDLLRQIAAGRFRAPRCSTPPARPRPAPPRPGAPPAAPPPPPAAARCAPPPPRGRLCARVPHRGAAARAPPLPRGGRRARGRVGARGASRGGSAAAAAGGGSRPDAPHAGWLLLPPAAPPLSLSPLS